MGLDQDIKVVYSDGGPIQWTSDEVLFCEPSCEDEGAFLDSTMYRILVPGENGGVANPPLTPGSLISYDVFVNDLPYLDCTPSFKVPSPAAESFRFVAFGNSGLATANQAALAGLLNGLDVDFFISAGDRVIRNNNYSVPPNDPPGTNLVVEPSRGQESADHLFYNVYSEALSRSVFYVAPGDEDLETFIPAAAPTIQDVGDYDAAYVARESSIGDIETTEQWYSFDHGNAHFTVLRSTTFHLPDIKFESTLFFSEQVNFLVNDLQNTSSAQERAAGCSGPL